jgi:acetyl-CoA synthetase
VLVVAYVILQRDRASAPTHWRPSASEHLAGYKAPKIVYFARELPRTRNGKILRRDISPGIAAARSAP